MIEMYAYTIIIFNYCNFGNFLLWKSAHTSFYEYDKNCSSRNKMLNVIDVILESESQQANHNENISLPM